MICVKEPFPPGRFSSFAFETSFGDDNFYIIEVWAIKVSLSSISNRHEIR